MSKITKVVRNAYDNAYDLSNKKKYSIPKIYNASGDITKRWYVYFSFRNPQTGKMERQPSIDTGVMRYKTLSGRNKAIKMLRDTVEDILKNGFNPYEETELIDEVKKYSTVEAIDFVLELTKSKFSASHYSDFNSRLQQFKKWLIKNGWEFRHITSVNRIAIAKYLNEVMKATSATNRNNTRIALSSFYSNLVSNNIVEANLVSDIPVEKAKAKRNKTFNSSQEEAIKEKVVAYPVLGLFIKFISYNFLRPVEVCRITIGDIDLKQKRVTLQTKTGIKTKIIPDILFEELPDMKGLPSDMLLFNRDKLCGYWPAKEENRRQYYSDLFFEVKTALGLSKDYTIYSFRHTFITKLYREFRKKLTPFEAESHLMLITGHASHDALKKYLRDIDAELPDDYSDSIKKVLAGTKK